MHKDAGCICGAPQRSHSVNEGAVIFKCSVQGMRGVVHKTLFIFLSVCLMSLLTDLDIQATKWIVPLLHIKKFGGEHPMSCLELWTWVDRSLVLIQCGTELGLIGPVAGLEETLHPCMVPSWVFPGSPRPVVGGWEPTLGHLWGDTKSLPFPSCLCSSDPHGDNLGPYSYSIHTRTAYGLKSYLVRQLKVTSHKYTSIKKQTIPL